MANSYTVVSINCETAMRLVERAVERAQADGVAVCVAIVDPRGSLKAFASMDGAPELAVETSKVKANTALMGLGSGDLASAMEGQWAQLASLAAAPGVTMLGGGLPLFEAGNLIGAIGVGGALTEQDIAIAEWGRQGLA